MADIMQLAGRDVSNDTRGTKHAVKTADGDATAVVVELNVSTGGRREGTEKVEKSFMIAMPGSLKDAILLEGQDKVFERYLSALAIAQQAELRRQIATTDGEKKERKRAGYLETLGV